MSAAPLEIPIVLLKTKSQPDDSYEDFFASHPIPPTTAAAIYLTAVLDGEHVNAAADNDAHESTSVSAITATTPRPIHFKPIFVPVLEHRQNGPALSRLGDLLRTNRLKDVYGGMIFTSQRAVEGWADTVLKVERECRELVATTERGEERHKTGNGEALFESMIRSTSNHEDRRGSIESGLPEDQAVDSRSNQQFKTDVQSDTQFPIYTVGPATSHALTTLIETVSSLPVSSNPPLAAQNVTITSSATPSQYRSRFLSLKPSILGEQTGNGANLAAFILRHYNDLHYQRWFTHYEAPRLPFVPLVGMGSENYSRKRLEGSDPRLEKKPLLFLVGEQRRDIIPKTLTDRQKLGDSGVIDVEEVEVYSTTVRDRFRAEFDNLVRHGFDILSMPPVALSDITRSETDFQNQLSRASASASGTDNDMPTGNTSSATNGTYTMTPTPDSHNDSGRADKDMTQDSRRSNSIGGQNERNNNVTTASKNTSQPPIVIIVVFSPQGSIEMLKSIQKIEEHRKPATPSNSSLFLDNIGHESSLSSSTSQSSSTPSQQNDGPQTKARYVIVSIGPTTRGYLGDTAGYAVDVCAKKPSPQGVWEGIMDFFNSTTGISSTA